MVSVRMAQLVERIKQDTAKDREQLPQPKPVEREPPVKRPAVEPPPLGPFDRLHAFGAKIVTQPDRIGRFVTWLYMLLWRSQEFIRVITSGYVNDKTHKERMIECESCPQAIIRMHRNGKETMYCQRCGCPKWRLAELRTKNRFNGWECPARRHDGPYRSDAWKDRYMELTGRNGVHVGNGNGAAPIQRPATGTVTGGCGGKANGH